MEATKEQIAQGSSAIVAAYGPLLCEPCKDRICRALACLSARQKAYLIVSQRRKAAFARDNLCGVCYARLRETLRGK